ncbi:hypothetical protein B0H12DRAFT_1137703 [Mycena haematopus]|nr:hypothetical protein B0H12DRAFT_1137703 [Mycena haematopus]
MGRSFYGDCTSGVNRNTITRNAIIVTLIVLLPLSHVLLCRAVSFALNHRCVQVFMLLPPKCTHLDISIRLLPFLSGGVIRQRHRLAAKFRAQNCYWKIWVTWIEYQLYAGTSTVISLFYPLPSSTSIFLYTQAQYRHGDATPRQCPELVILDGE